MKPSAHHLIFTDANNPECSTLVYNFTLERQAIRDGNVMEHKGMGGCPQLIFVRKFRDCKGSKTMIDFTATYWLAEGYIPWHGRIGNDAPEVKECKAIPKEAGDKA